MMGIGPWLAILVNFDSVFPSLRGQNFESDISRTLCLSAAKFVIVGVWPIDTYFLNLANLGSDVPRYHTTACISPSVKRSYY